MYNQAAGSKSYMDIFSLLKTMKEELFVLFMTLQLDIHFHNEIRMYYLSL